MKIVFFDYVINFGGAAQLTADTAKRLAVDHEVEVIDFYGACEPFLKTLEEAKIKVHILAPEMKDVYIGYANKELVRLWRIIKQIPVFVRLHRKLVRTILEINPDVIWTSTRPGLFFLGSSFRLRRYPLTMEVVSCPGAYRYRGYRKWLMKHRIDILMAISTEVQKQLQLAGISQDRIRNVFDTIDMADTLKRSSQPLEAPLPGMDAEPRIVVPANLIHKKGQHAAIKAVARLKLDGLNPTLWLAGGIVGNDRSYLEYLQDLAQQLNVAENVHFLGWRYDVPAIINHAQIVVFPTHEEGFGHVILEAMLLRRPVIAPPVGGIKDSIQHGINGLNFPVDNDEALADNIVKLHTDKRLVATLTENGYKTATGRFSPENHTKRFTQALIEAMKRKKAVNMPM